MVLNLGFLKGQTWCRNSHTIISFSFH